MTEERFVALEQRVEALEKLLASETNQPAECREKACSYWTHYLVHHDTERNGPRLEHASYHAAEKQCEQAQQRVMDWYDAHESGPLPGTLERLAAYYERKCCA